MKIGRVGRLEPRPLTGTWYRALRLKHWKTRLSSDHTRMVTSRFSAATPASPAYRIIYLAAGHRVALHEAGVLLGRPSTPVSNPRGSWAILSICVILDNIVDLGGAAEQTLLSTNHAELTGSWLTFPGQAPTQELGRALYDRPDVEGFLYPSSLVDELCLGIFPDKLGPRSNLVFQNEIQRNRREKLF